MKRIKNIVLIDDNESINYYHKYILDASKKVENILCADNVDDAKTLLEVLRDSKKDLELSIIFLDINLPKYSGFELINRNEILIKDLVNHGVKVYMLSSSQNPADLEIVKEMHLIEGFYEKPLKIDILDEICYAIEVNNKH